MKLTLGFGVFPLTFMSSDARPTFVARVPNGNGVTTVVALGHVNTAGGGATNAFGEAFGAAGYEWTSELCQADSDRDGATNGEELGDPCCTWTSSTGFDSASMSAQSSPTHPGVANSFTESQLASMACNGEADVDVIASSDAASSTSSLSLGSQSSRFGSNSSSSGSSDDVVTIKDQPHVSRGPTVDQTSVTSDGNQLKTFVYCFSIVLVLAAS